jgi:predicted porin
MKKHLIAAAVAGAFALPAMAQNVTLYGTIDAGVASFNKVGTVSTNETVYADGSISSSVWGLRGTEDLGGGLRAVFQLESDIQTNNGGLNQNGLFRRAAYAGVTGGFGELTFGLRLNPLIAQNSALMPVAGNSVSTLLATALSYHNFYTKNAITYTSPSFGGLVAQLQHGLANSTSTVTTGGSVTAGSLVFTQGPLAVRFGMHDRKANGAVSSANTSNNVIGTAPTIDFAATAYVAGISYTTGPLTMALAQFQNKEATATSGGAKIERSGYQVGLGYNASAAWRLGLSYTEAEGSSLTNAQARYMLSKRTTGYVMAGVSDNSTNGTSAKQVSFLPYALNTGSQPAGILDSYAGIAGRKSTAIGLGLIHSF